PALTGAVLAAYAGDQSSSKIENQPWISKREEEVLKLIAWGYSNKEIAAKLDISVKTVEAHRANAMRKLDLHSRIDIVRFALMQGWLEED
ncbi:MAG TPA: response regulator transcription factor, partial [Blastocatellia bacterium]